MPASHGAEPRKAESKARLPEPVPHPVPEAVAAAAPQIMPEAAPSLEGDFAPLGESQDARLILLSRTLAGLVDFIIVFLSAGMMMVAVDILEGIDVFDTVGKINYGFLLLVMYFVYSFFFLGMSGQTIGMMLTDLKLTGISRPRPALLQILVRCCTFLAGTALAGLGLLWGCFDHQARCLHDHLSGTRVVRTLLY